MSKQDKSSSEQVGKIVLNGEVYSCSIIDGVKYVDGLTIDQFVDKLSKDKDQSGFIEAVKIGKAVAADRYNKGGKVGKFRKDL